MYDIVSTCVYAELNQELALSIGDEFDAAKIGAGHWSDLAYDFGLNPRAFERERDRLARLVPASARDLADDAREHGWHRPILDDIVDLINRRVGQL